MHKFGYAVAVKDLILVETVSPTPRAAMVNWLYALCNIPTYTRTTDEQIRDMFLREMGKCNAKLVRVLITDDPNTVCDPKTIDLLKG